MTAAIDPNSHTLAHRGSVVPHAAVSPRLAPEVYRARRLAVLAVAFGVLVGSVVGISSIGSQAGASRGDLAGPDESLLITVMPGDTLWDIARGLDPDADPRALVHELSAIAGDGPLQPGQQLAVPRSALD